MMSEPNYSERKCLMSETLLRQFLLEMQRTIGRLGYGMTNYRHPLRQGPWRVAVDTPKKIPLATTPLECVELFQAAMACHKIQGDMAEAGVYRGGTAAILLSASAEKRLHLFDTFAGLPSSEGKFEKGDWTGTLAEVKRDLSEWHDRLDFHPGFFPESAVGLEDLRFSFVHLDLDLYASTISALEWFWPRLNRGGALLSHDYPSSDGVVRAFHEYFDPRGEVVFPLSGDQCFAVKTTA